MQNLVNQLNRDVVELTKQVDELWIQHLRDEMKRLNESWSQVISANKASSQHLQDVLKRTKLIEDDIRDISEWIHERNQQILLEDDAIFYSEQLRDRFDFFQVRINQKESRRSTKFLHLVFQKLQTELNFKEHSVRTLVEQIRQESTHSSAAVDNLITNWSNLTKKVDGRTKFLSDVYRLYEELQGSIELKSKFLF